jgi:hypothetical protein
MDRPNENDYRFVAILNKKVELGRLMNALGHMTAGLVGGYAKAQDMHFLEYQDKDGGIHPYISHFPFIVLKAENSNQIRTVRNELLKRTIPFTDFAHTMIVGTSEEQQKATSETTEADLDYFGICMFADTNTLKEFTKKFSLFK